MKTCGKIMLFGEYSILAGSDALTVPLKNFYGEWAFSARPTKSNTILSLYHSYLASKKFDYYLDLNSFRTDIESGIQFKSTIPQGYGAGSSGALVAAVLKRYGLIQISETSLPELKKILGRMESYFHGQSSGIDPLSCYLEKPLLFQPDSIEPINLNKKQETFFLLDSGIQRNTSEGVKSFMQKLTEIKFNSWFMENYVPVNNRCIAAFSSKSTHLFNSFDELSKIQFDIFSNQIPEKIKTVWENFSETKHTRLKLCGAGGGGLFIGITKDQIPENVAFDIIPLNF